MSDVLPSAITHLPLDEQWLRDLTNAGPHFVAFEKAVGALEANQVRKVVLTHLAEGVQICELLGTDPESCAPGHSYLAKGQVWHLNWFTAETPAPVIEAGCKVYSAGFQSNDGTIIDFRLVSR